MGVKSNKKANDLPRLEPSGSFNANKSLYKSYVAVFKVTQTTLPEIDDIDCCDIRMLSIFENKMITLFVSKKSGIDPGIDRYSLNILLTLASFARPNAVLIGNGKTEPRKKGLCKNAIHSLMPYCSNYSLTAGLNDLLSKQLISQWNEKTDSGRDRRVFTVTLAGHHMVGKFNEFYKKYLSEIYKDAERPMHLQNSGI